MSDIAEFLRSRYTPTDDQVDILTQDIHDIDSQIGNTEFEIVKIQKALLALQNEQRGLRRNRARRMSLLAPIRRLPPEILSYIFYCTLKDEKYATPDPKETPLVVSQVSSTWRSIALATPHMWTSFSFDLMKGEESSVASLVELWLKRSAECPISFSLKGTHQLSKHAAIPLILANSHRWSDVSLALPGEVLEEFNSVHGKVPELRSLSLFPVGSDPVFVSGFEHAPKLRSLHISAPPTVVALPWDQLTHCYVTALTPSESLHFFALAPNLKYASLTFGFSTSFSAPATPRPGQISHDLKALNVTSKQSIDLRPLLDCITLPSLEALAVAQRGLNLETSVLPLLIRSESSLTHISLENAILGRSQLESLLQRSSNLSYLQIGGCENRLVDGISDEFLESLTPSSANSTTALPNLRTLDLWGPLQFSSNKLLNLVESRKSEGMLKRLRVDYYQKMADVILGELRSLGGDDLTVTANVVPITSRFAAPYVVSDGIRDWAGLIHS